MHSSPENLKGGFIKQIVWAKWDYFLELLTVQRKLSCHVLYLHTKRRLDKIKLSPMEKCVGFAWQRRADGDGDGKRRSSFFFDSPPSLQRGGERGNRNGDVPDKAEKGGLTATHEKKGHKLLQCNSRESG